jgi:transglutaminase-like putative cysteine protease
VSRRSPIGPAAGAALAVLVLGVAWAGLYEDVAAGHVLALCAVAALPAAATRAPRLRVALTALAALAAAGLALGLALRRSPLSLLALDGEAWAEARAILPEGLRAGSDASLPVSPGEHPELVALLDLALVALAAAAAWQILARRRPVAGLVAVGVGLAYRWTVEPPGEPVLAGALALAALAGVLALASWEGGSAGRAARRAGGALALGGVAVAVAAGLGAGPAQAGDAWWSWKDWELGGGGDGSGAALDLRQRYGKLDWPQTPRVAMTVESDRALPLRAVSLGEFDGIAFTLAEAVTGGPTPQPLPVVDGAIEVGDGGEPDGDPVAQRITLVGASSQVVLASGRPQRVSGRFGGSADLLGDGIRVEEGLDPGDRYSVRTSVPDPTPAELVAASEYDPGEVPAGATVLRPGFWARPVEVPLWGGGGPAPDDALLGPYARVRELARSVVGDARTPYAAVNRIESHLRRGYVYDERPPYPTSLPDDWSAGLPEVQPPLVDFLFGSRRGFCQHFAGSMAVMLRAVGIPARVAVGYTGGNFDAERDAWVILDRDAHSWVEVWFPDQGWLPFDPTPGRAAPNPASVSSPDYSPTAFEVDVGGLEDAAVAPPEPQAGAPEPEAAAEDEAAQAEPAVAEPVGGGPAWEWALLALALPVAAAPAVRAVRRARGRRRGDERARVVAAAREFEASLRALGWAPSPAGSASERAAAVRARTGVDPSGLYRRASQARFAPGPVRAGAAEAAWREATSLRRAVVRRASPGRRLRAALGLGRRRRGTVIR